MSLEWVKEVEYKDLIQADPVLSLIANECGEDVALALAIKFTRMNIYISEKFSFAIKRRYAKKFFRRDPSNARELAAFLNVGDKFIYNAVSAPDKKDDRQESLL